MTLTLNIDALVAVLFPGCSGDLLKTFEETLPDDQALYKSDKKTPKLEIPPSFDASEIEESLEIPGEQREETTLSAYQGAQLSALSTAGVLAWERSSARIERDGDKRWLVVKATPSEVWSRVRTVFLNNGLVLEREAPSLGILETTWAEHSEALPLNPLRRFFSRVNKAAYTFATRDKFRARLEHGTQSGTIEVHISHRGAQEQSQGDNYVWTPRPSDPGLEAEMLGRLMVAFGAKKEELTDKTALDRIVLNEDVDTESAPIPTAYLIHAGDGRMLLSFEGDFTQAWWRISAVLNGSDFTVKDRDRSRGLFFVHYTPERASEGEKKGFFAKLKFWGEEEPLDNEFLIRLTRSGEVTDIFVFDTQGNYAREEVAERILSILHESLSKKRLGKEG